MTFNAMPLLAGAPRFADTPAAEPASPANLQQAWLKALLRGPRDAAASTQGSFAVGLQLPDQRVFLAVDRFSVESLCYRIDGDQLRFARRADELADGASINPQGIFDYLYFHVLPSPHTIFNGVFRLPPGHFAVFANGQLTVEAYWTATFEEPSAASFHALKDEFRQILKTAVATQLDGSKAACFLSGGTDSSTIAGMIAQAGGGQAASYSIGFEAEGYDEMEYARIAAKHFNTEHHEYYVTPADLVRSIPAVAAHYDQPFGNSSALPAFYCAKMARENGVTRILAGDGGDELFGGNTRYAKQKIFGYYDAVPAGLRHGFLEPMMATTLAQRVPLLRKAASYVNQAKVPMPDRLQTYNLLERLGTATVLTDRFLAAVDEQSPRAHQRQVWAESADTTLVNRMLAFDWRYTLAEADLPKVCGTTALAGVSVGFPMLDDRLLAFSERLPEAYKLKGLHLRWFFKEALRGFLPDSILTKKKQGFGLPFGVWATRDAGLKALAAQSVEALVERGLVNGDFSRRLLGTLLYEHPGYYGEMVWILMMLEQWLRKHAPGFRL